MNANPKTLKQIRKQRRRRLALALACVLASPLAFGQSLPSSTTLPTTTPINYDPTKITSINVVGSDMTITQVTDAAVIGWTTFNVGSAASVTFVQPGVNSVVLNYIDGIIPAPFIINGAVNANGSVFFVNPNGIWFGPNANVNVGGLVASTLNISAADFYTGAAMANPHYVFGNATDTIGGGIVNQGHLNVTSATGTIALLAARVENQAGGVINAPGGSAIIGAAAQSTLDFYNDGLTTLAIAGNGLYVPPVPLGPINLCAAVPLSACLGGIVSIGNIAAVGGHVELRTQTMDGLANTDPLFTESPTGNGGRIWIGGRIDARTAGADTGSIIIDAGHGNVDIGGVAGQMAWVNTTGVNAGENAGSIQIRGNQLFTYLCVGPGGVCTTNDSLGFIDASGYNTGNGGHIQIDVLNLFYNAGVIQAASMYGAGGTVDIVSGNSAENYNWIIAEGVNGGTINITAPSILLHRGQLPWLGSPSDILYSQAVLSAYGSNGNGGTVNLTGGLSVIDLGNVTPADPEFAWVINVRGMNGNGGTVYAFGDDMNVTSTKFANANGTVDGGTITFDMLTNNVAFAASMEANGQRDGGRIDIRGGYIDLTGASLYAHGSRDGGEIYVAGGYVVMSGGDIDVQGGVVPSNPSDPHLGNGGTINLYGTYYVDVQGSFNANGSVDGGMISFGSANYVTVDGLFTADGGASPLAADSHYGDGGHIYVQGDTVDVAGTFSANAGIGPNPDPMVDNYGGHIRIDGSNVTLDGQFSVFGFLGDLFTAGNDHLYVAPSTIVSAANWSIAGSEVWITTAAGASGHSQGAVVVDQALATALGYGTWIDLRADNATYSPSGSGALTIDSGVSILPTGTGFGRLDLRGRNGISGSDFTIEADWGVYLQAYGSAIDLDNFTMSGNTVEMVGGNIDLTSGHIEAGDGGFTATAISAAGGINLYSSWIESTGTGDITLDASNTANGIEAQWLYLTTAGGDIVLNADYSLAGVHLWSLAEIDSGGGDVTITAYGSTGGITIEDTTANSGAGVMTVESDGNVQLSNSTLHSDFNLVINGGAGVQAQSSNLSAGTVDMRSGGDILVDASVVTGGFLSMHANGITMTNGTNAYMGGVVDMVAYGDQIVIDHSSVASLGGDISMVATGVNGGVALYASSIDSHGGDITLDGNGHYGVRLFNGTRVDGGGGDVLISGNGTGTGGVGVWIDQTSGVYTTTGDTAITGESADSTGLRVTGTIATNGGDIALTGTSNGAFFSGVDLNGASVSSDAGDIEIHGYHGTGNGGVMIEGGSVVSTTTGDITITGDGGEIGVWLYQSALITDSGVIALSGTGLVDGVVLSQTTIDGGSGDIRVDGIGYGGVGAIHQGVVIAASHLYTDGGDITVTGHGDAGAGVGITQNSSLSTTSGDITISGYSSGFTGVIVYQSDLTTTSGDVTLHGEGATRGVYLGFTDILSALDGDIAISGTGGDIGIFLHGSNLIANGGDIDLYGSGDTDAGVRLDGNFQVRSDSGDIDILGYSLNRIGVDVSIGYIGTNAGDIDITGEGGSGGVLLDNVSVESTSGNIAVSGNGGTGVGVLLAASSLIDAGSGIVELRAGNNGATDAIVLNGSISSTTAVNLRPWSLTDTILFGTGGGFVLDNAELSNIHTPWLVVGSAQHQGAIQVAANTTFAGNLVLQNQGAGAAGIFLGATLNVGGHTLGLLSGGDIVQTAAGMITAEHLLADSAGDVRLNAVANAVSANSVAGHAGGDFLFLNGGALSIGTISAFGFDASSGTMTALSGSGITGGTVLIQNLSGNLTLNADVSGTDVDLVTAGVFLNPGGYTITAGNAWRVWASTWVGEDRGGLTGSGSLPNLYNCTYLGPCGVTVSGSENHFIYTAQPTVIITADDQSYEYGDVGVLTYSASGLILGDLADNALFGALAPGDSYGFDVGTYAITGGFTSPAGYNVMFTPGTLTITPATLLFTADPATWYFGLPGGVLTGTVTGFKYGDTLLSVFGTDAIWFTLAGPTSIPGYYAIYGGTSAHNYVFAQAPGNATALHILPVAQTSDLPFDLVADPPETYVYERNFDTAQMCPIGEMENDTALAGGDPLGNEWSKVRKRLNLVNCFSNDRRGGCGSF